MLSCLSPTSASAATNQLATTSSAPTAPLSSDVMRSLKTTKDDELRFWRFVNLFGPYPDPSRPVEGRCWTWKGYTDRKGYGIFSLRTGSVKAHRVSFVMYGGILTAEQDKVDHRCRNTSCVRRSHLEAVTDSENQRRKRHAIQDQLDLYAEAWEAAQ
jgi:hypothetical protein